MNKTAQILSAYNLIEDALVRQGATLKQAENTIESAVVSVTHQHAVVRVVRAMKKQGFDEKQAMAKLRDAALIEEE